MGMTIDDLKKECRYCYREIDNSGLEGFRCTNRTAIKARESSWCYPKNANEPCSICEYCEPKQNTGMTKKEETLDWLYRLRSEIYVYMPKEWLIPMNNALDVAIKAIEQEPILDKIKAEIKDIAFDWQEIDGEHKSFMVVDLNDALNIIDKYMPEIEE